MTMSRWASCLAPLLLLLAGASGDTEGPRYTADGLLVPPVNYREWVYLSSGLDMSYSDGAPMAGHSMFDNVFIDPAAWAAFKRTGHWPDRTIFVMEVRGAASKGSINKQGHYQTEELMGALAKLKAQFTLAHMGMFLARDGVVQPGFQRLLELLRHGDGRCWVKLTGVYRMSVAPGFGDAAPMARALIDAAPDRIIWGSDYPHLSFADKVGSVQLYNLLGRWAPEETVRRRILVDNPQRLFGF